MKNERYRQLIIIADCLYRFLVIFKVFLVE